jgi:hypothetical protein
MSSFWSFIEDEQRIQTATIHWFGFFVGFGIGALLFAPF